MTEYNQEVVLICTDKAAGNYLAGKAASFPDDPNAEANTFTDGMVLSPQAWYSVIPAKSSFASVCQAIAENADYSDPRLDYLKESPRNVTEQDWMAAKALIKAAVFDRSTYSQSDLETFVAGNGYSILEPQEP